ncbi:MAG: hypothetical protein JO257_14520 [Deltaproteobacteria bacterium]|nr:hypothetical protein [Deltaproteobacteria bacterium]
MRTLVWLFALAACGSPRPGGAPAGGDAARSDGAGGAGDAAPQGTYVFDPAVTKVVVEIDYETGEAPYTGTVVGFGDTFDLTVNNLDRLFASKKALTVPRTLAAMEDVGVISDEELTTTDILALAAAHRQQHDTADTKTYYVIFVSGHYADANGPNSQVLGVEVGMTGIVAIFKDVIKTTEGGAVPNISRYVEQSTLTHELAHGIGLVDNGVPMVADHKDAPHGAHCTNSHCIMYWANEGTSGAVSFATQNITGGNTILFDAACLADVDAKN